MSVVSSLTDELGGFVGSLVDEALEGFLHGVDEAVVPLEAALRHVVHLVLEVQQLLNHLFIFLRRTHDLSTEALQGVQSYLRITEILLSVLLLI